MINQQNDIDRLDFEQELSMCLRLEKASQEELTLALTSSNQLERWYALFCLQKKLNGGSNV